MVTSLPCTSLRFTALCTPTALAFFSLDILSNMLSFNFLLSFSALLPLAHAAPLPLFGINFGSGAVVNGNPTTVSQSTIDSSLKRPALFARAAYCSPQSVQTLSCGGPCDAINTIKVLQGGGDESDTPRCRSTFVFQDSFY